MAAQLRGSSSASVLDRLGVRRAINAAGAYTKLGGAQMAPEALAAFNEAASQVVNLNELHEKAGQYLARRLGVEAAYISSGASGGIFVATAACLAGTDPQRIEKLPDLPDGPDEVVTLRAHRCTYNQCVRAAGGKIREVGSAAGATPEQFTAALGERTAAVLFYDMYSLAGGLALSTIVKLVRDHPLSRARRIPILVDAAAELPPRENLTRYLRQGADLVIFSGGKELRGPQGTGLVLGRRELIAGCLANGCPKDAIGRPLKVTKEEIAALVAAVDRYLELDLDAQWRNWQGQVNWLVEQLNRCTHVHAEAFIMPPTSTCRPLIPNALIRWDEKALGKTISQVAAALREGDPAIYLRREGSGLAFNPHVLQPGQEETVVRRLKEVLAGA